MKRPYTPEMSDDTANRGMSMDDDLFIVPAVVIAAGKPRKKHARPPTFEEGFGSVEARTSGGKYFTHGAIAMD